MTLEGGLLMWFNNEIAAAAHGDAAQTQLRATALAGSGPGNGAFCPCNPECNTRTPTKKYP